MATPPAKPPVPSSLPPPPPSTTAAPRAPLARGRKLVLAVVAAVVLVAVAAVVVIQQRNRVPSSGLVRDEVEKLLSGQSLKVTQVNSTITPTSPGHATVSYQAEAEVSEALFALADSTTFLRDELKLDPAAWQKVRKVLSGKTAPRILELAGLKGLDETLLLSTFLHQTTAVGTRLAYSGNLRATRGDHGWLLESEQLTRTAGTTEGKPRAAFGAVTTVINDPAELKKLRALAVVQADLPAKVEEGRQAFLRERQAEQEKIIAQLLDTIKAGTLYGGTVTAGGNAAVRVFLEFTEVNPKSRQVTAVLRNDGGWSDRRPLRGEFTFDPDDETLALALESPARQAVREAGPILSDGENLRLAFQLNGGRLTARDSQREFSLTRLSEGEVTTTRQEIEGPEIALRDAVSPGRVYRGTIRGRDGAQTFDYLLRFHQLDSETGTLAATLEPAGREAWRRPFRGSLVANRYRAQGAPLRLETRASEALKAADRASPAGLNRSAAVSLKLLDGHFQGETEDFSYDFAPLSTEEIAKLEAAAAEREQALLAIVKEHTAYPGVARLAGKSTAEKIRLRFRRVEPHGAAVDAVIESLERPGVFRELRGTLDTFEKRLVLTTTGRGRTSAGSRAGLKFPPLIRSSGELVLSLAVSGSGLNGELQNQNWKLDFPAAGAIAVAGDSVGDYPTEAGAYVWMAGSWQALPSNHGKVTKSALQVLGGLFNALSKTSSSSAAGDKVAELTFSGEDSVPAVPGTAVIVVYVGPIRSEVSARYSQLRSYPEIEMAPTARDSDGNRKVSLTRIAANVSTGGFRERRVTAELDRVSDDIIELSCTRTLAPGSYAVSVNDEYYELNVE